MVKIETDQPPRVSLQDVLDRLENVTERNGGYRAPCPAHDGKTMDSLSVIEGDNGKAVVHCFGAKCSYEEIMTALSLWGSATSRPSSNGSRRRKQSKKQGKQEETYTTEYVYSRPVYEFRNLAGEVVYVQRHKGPYYRRVDDDRWVANLDGVQKLPYRLPELVEGVRAKKTVFHVEGCKDADTATERLKVPATTTGGVNTWRSDHRVFYQGADVVILPDNDAEGLNYAHQVAAELAGMARSVKIVQLPGLPEKGDLTDFMEAGGTPEQVFAVVKAAPYYDPANPANPTNLTNPANPANRTPPMSASALMGVEFEDTRWVVPDVLPEGLFLLAGKPKKGKSWMGLGICEAVAAGGVAFGTKRVEQGDSLYLALEDNRKRLQKRLRKVLDGRAAPEGMYVHTEWPRLGEGGAELLDEWLTEHPNARVVIIDTLAKIRAPARGQNVYAEDYAALEQLLPLATKHGVAIVVVHHLRKMAAADPMDEISSSTGLTAGVDGFLILRRTPGSKGPTLYVDGRDIEEPTEYALHWNMNTATWTIEGDAEEVHISKERADILLTLNRSAVPMTPKEVSDVMPGAKYGNVKYLMWTMLGDGQLLKHDGGRYSPANPTNPPTNPTNPPEGDRHEESDDRVSGVSGVSGMGREDVEVTI